MPDKIDINALNKAFEETEKEIKELNKQEKLKPKENKQLTVTEKKDKKGKTITKKITKKDFKKPEDYNDNPLAQSINKLADKLVKEEGASNECQFGQSVALVIDYYFTDLPDHPLVYLAVSSSMLTFKGLVNHDMIPFLKKKSETESKSEVDFSMINNSQIIETPEYKKQKTEIK